MYSPLYDAHDAMNSRNALATVFVFVLALLGGARAWECPVFDEEKVMDILMCASRMPMGFAATHASRPS